MISSETMVLVGQDHRDFVVHKPMLKTGGIHNNSQLRKATLQGGNIETVAKSTKTHGSPSNARKIESKVEEGDFHVERVKSELRHAIRDARNKKHFTQAQLAQQVNEKPFVIQEYENGKAIPNPQVLNKLSRVLGVHLRR